jgi:hypothetical protein
MFIHFHPTFETEFMTPQPAITKIISILLLRYVVHSYPKHL